MANPVTSLLANPSDPRTERFRRRRFKDKKRSRIAHRVCRMADEDWEAMSVQRERQLQLTAKYRMWSEGSNGFPWPDSSDYAVPDMTTDSLRTQDTIHNAVLSNRPAVTSKAVNKENQEKQDQIDHLLDHQLFVEQDGERLMGDLADAFTNEPVATLFIPWVREDRKVSELKIFPRIPMGSQPEDYFRQLLDQEFPEHQYRSKSQENMWEWQLFPPEDETEAFQVSFYTRRDDKKIEMITGRTLRVFEGPSYQVKDASEVLYPSRAANLQIPGPSNPKGAAHVILVDYPTVDEIKRLHRDGFYDEVSLEDIKSLSHVTRDTTQEHAAEQIDALEGHNDDSTDTHIKDKSDSHATVTRYTCFDRFDIDGDGLDEDVIFWVILEGKLLLRWRELGEVYPLKKGRRPFAESSFLPVKGRRAGISLLELMESTHDTIKQLFDQMVDSGTLANSPFGFYRPSSNAKPEVMNIYPGDLWPLQNPTQDINFPDLSSANSQAFALNTIGTLQQLGMKLTMQGDLAFGQVPKGKSSALRTSGNLESLISMGEARPERILRRFFIMLADACSIAHELNTRFLPKEKKFRVIGVNNPGMDPYMNVEREKIDGDFEFDFLANIQNASKVALQQALEQAIGMALSPIAFQAGVSTPDTVYRVFVDTYKALGLDPERYANRPTPTSEQEGIFAEEALTQIIMDQAPSGLPLEPGGAEEHIQKLIAFIKTDAVGVLTPQQTDMLKLYMREMAQLAAAQQQAQALQQAAGASNLGPGGQPGPAANQPADLSQPPVQGGELVDESLPGAGGGANTG